MPRKKKTEDDPIEFTPDPELEDAVAGSSEDEPAESEDEGPPTGTLADAPPDEAGRLSVTLEDGTERKVEPDEYEDLGDGKVKLRR